MKSCGEGGGGRAIGARPESMVSRQGEAGKPQDGGGGQVIGARDGGRGLAIGAGAGTVEGD